MDGKQARPGRVVNVRFFEPWGHTPRGYVYVGRAMPQTFRGSVFSNRYSHNSTSRGVVRVRSADAAVRNFRVWLFGGDPPAGHPPDGARRRRDMLAALPLLRARVKAGFDLGCWCVDERGNGVCHARVLRTAVLCDKVYEMLMGELDPAGRARLEADVRAHFPGLSAAAAGGGRDGASCPGRDGGRRGFAGEPRRPRRPGATGGAVVQSRGPDG